MIQTSICMPFSCPPPCPGCDTLPAEFPTLPEQQDELQLGVRDAPVSGLHLRKHNWRTWASWSVHKREKRGADQPDTGKFDRVLSGAMPRKPGNVSVAGQSSPLLPCACSVRSAGLGSQPAQLVLSYTATHFVCLTKRFWFGCFVSLSTHNSHLLLLGASPEELNHSKHQSKFFCFC